MVLFRGLFLPGAVGADLIEAFLDVGEGGIQLAKASGGEFVLSGLFNRFVQKLPAFLQLNCVCSLPEQEYLFLQVLCQ